MTTYEIETINAMEKYGGSFVKALARAMRAADGSNFYKLKTAFPEYWKEYSAWAARDANKSDQK